MKNFNTPHAPAPESDSFKTETESSYQTVAEILDPRTLSGIAFQAYTSFQNDSEQIFSDFRDDKIYNPNLSYPKLQEVDALNQTYLDLLQAKTEALQITDDELHHSVIESTIDHSLRKLFYVGKLMEIDYYSKRHQSIPSESITQARELNRQVYGEPDPKITNGILNQIWQTLDQKNFSSSASQLYNELKNGFDYQNNHIDGLPLPENNIDQLPDFDADESLAWAGEYILEKNSDIEALITELWDQKVEIFGKNYEADPEDIKEFFEQVLCLRDPNHESGITVKFDPNAKNLSWSTANMAVVIGDQREPISSSQEMFKKVLHEFGVHGQRAINGLETGLPILGSGLFTNSDPADYLSFEEGLATLLEAAVDKEKTNWTPANMSLYLNIALVERGCDFRDIYELGWRYRTLYDIEPNQEISDELINKHKKLAYKSAVRVFRGNPTDPQSMPGQKPLTYNKDLSYLRGRLSVMSYLKQAWEEKDTAKLDDLFAAKFDPTIPEQRAIVDQLKR